MSHNDETTAVSQLITPSHSASGPTLLPGPVASFVSLFSKSTTVSIRLGSLIGETALDAARIGTLTGLELGRAAVEGILARAGRDVSSRRGAGGGEDYVEGWTEKGINLLRSSISLTQLLLSTGFEISSTTLTTLSAFAETYVLTLDSIFGSTESSRAISAIVTLIRKEFDENTEGEGRIGAADLVIGLTCFAVLQMKTRARSDKEIRVELVWDVVVDEVGKKVDVVAEARGETKGGIGGARPVSPFLEDAEIKDVSRKIEKVELDEVSLLSGDEGENENGYGLPPMFFAKLPSTADLSITTSSTITKTTTVEVVGTEPPDFIPPKDAVILSEDVYHEDNRPRYKIVYKTVTKKAEKKRMRREDDDFVVVDREKKDTGRVLGEVESEAGPSTSTRFQRSRSGSSSKIRRVIGRASSLEKELPAAPSERTKHKFGENIAEPAEANSRKRLLKQNTSTSGKEGAKQTLRGEDKEERGGEKRQKEKDKEKQGGKKDKRENTSKALSSKPSKDGEKAASQPLLPSPNPKGRQIHAVVSPLSSYSLPSGRPTSPQSPDIHYQRSSSRSRIFRRETSISNLSEISHRDTYICHDSSSVYSSPPPHSDSPSSASSACGHLRGSSYSPSIYTIATTQSQTSLLLESYIPQPGSVFPNTHLYNNFAKYMRFAAASYGQNFMRFLGLGKTNHVFPSTSSHHAEHHAFSYHTELPLDTILLSSFADPGGGYDSEGNVNSGIPLVHFVAIDHPSKAVVVTCRGTLGLEDVLTDLTCEYQDLHLRGVKYRVHKGMLNSALLLLKKRSRLLVVVKAALEEFKEYGLVLTGHSLGGGVAAILAILLSIPSNSSFVTHNVTAASTDGIRIPEGRKIHCYAFGTPACVSEELRRTTRTLITTVVHGHDVVPCLSFGIIRDFWTVAVAFKEDTKGAKAEIRRRILDGLSKGNLGGSLDHDDWAFAVMKTLRALMMAEKLVPPGEVWNVTMDRVFEKKEGEQGEVKVEGKVRVKACVVRDVKKRFQEVGFGSGMFADHSPKCYEVALDALRRGVEG